MSPRALTKPQLAALDWLTTEFRGDYPRGMQIALRRLSVRGLAEFDWGWDSATFGMCRLTSEGQALKRARALSELAAMDAADLEEQAP